MTKSLNQFIPIEERFWQKVDASGDCWEWTGCVNEAGYGTIRIGVVNGRYPIQGVHRWAWEHLVGPIPEGQTIDHLCKNPPCVNPDHLEPVPMGVNVLRGENPAAQNRRKYECVNGHWFSPENTNLDATGRRNCRTCRREYMRARRAQRKAST